MAMRSAALASLLLVLFALAFLFVPQWLIVDLSIGSRSVRIWLAMGWVVVALCLTGRAAARISSRGREFPEPEE